MPAARRAEPKQIDMCEMQFQIPSKRDIELLENHSKTFVIYI